MHEMHKALSTKADVKFMVISPKAFPFTKRWRLNHSRLVHDLAQRVHYISIPKRKFPSIIKRRLLSAVVPKLNEEEFDILHLHWAFPEILLLPELKRFNKPIILTLHGFLFFDIYQNKKLKPYLENALLSVDKILTVGKELKKQVCELFPEVDHKCFHIPNGVNPNQFRIEDKTKTRQSLKWDANGFHILTVANIAPEKGIIDLVKAVLISEELRLSTFHIIGRIINQRYFDEIQALISDNGLTNIKFYGPLSHSELLRYYSAADLFVLPSRNEGFGVALVEAGMCGIPLVSTKSGGPNQIITSENGRLAPPANPELLANEIKYMKSNIERYDAGIIRETMTERYSQAKIADEIISHYQTLLS